MKKPLIYNFPDLFFNVERRNSLPVGMGMLSGLSLLSAMALVLNACGNSANVVDSETEGQGSNTPAVALSAGEDTGSFASDRYTRENQPFFDVTGPINSTFELKLQGTGETVAQGTIGSNGKTSIQSNRTFDDDDYTFSVTSDKGSGQQESITVTIDTMAERLAIDNSVAPNFSDFQKDQIINKNEINSIVLAGRKAEANAEISFLTRVNDGGKQTFSDVTLSFLNDEGSVITALNPKYDVFYQWRADSIDIESLGLQHGDTVSIQAVQEDAAGNVSSPSDALDFTVDLEAPMLVADKPVTVTVGSNLLTFEFDDNIEGIANFSDFGIEGTRAGGGGIAINENQPFSIDGTTLTITLLQEWQEGTSITSISYTGTGILDNAGNKVDAFEVGADDVNETIDPNTGGTGTETPENLTIDVISENGTLTIMEDAHTFHTNDNTPEIILSGTYLNDSLAKLYFGTKPIDGVDDVFIVSDTVMLGNSISFEWGEEIMRDPLEDGTYKLFFITSNQAEVDGETIEYTLTIDTMGPSVIADTSGFTRTDVASFQVTLNEEAYYDAQTRETLRGSILNNVKLIGEDGMPIILSDGEAFANVMFTGEDETNQTFTGFTFEISGTTSGVGILNTLASQEAIRFSLAAGTIKDRLGNTNDDLAGVSTFSDFRPPSGEIKGFGANSLLIYFPKGAVLTSSSLDAINYRVEDSDGGVYTIDGTPIFDENTGILTINTLEEVVNKEIYVTIPAGDFKSYGLTWENANVEHVVTADLRQPKPPTIDLLSAYDSGAKNDDNVTKFGKPHINFTIGADGNEGTLEITITGVLNNGESYEKTIHTEIGKGEVYTINNIDFGGGTYKIAAVMVDKFGRRSNEGLLEIPANFSNYELSGTNADLFEITQAGVLYLVDKASGVGGSYEVTVNYRDGDGDLISKDVTVTIVSGNNDTNSTPVFVPDLPDVVHVVSGDTEVDSFSASDSDTADSVMYSIEGNDADKFDIDPDTGEVSFKTAPDVASPDSTGKDNSYKITIIATDGKEEIFHDVSVEVVNETLSNEAPMFADGVGSMDVTAGERFVGLFNGTDADNDKLFYSIEGEHSHLLEITSGGVLRFRDAPASGHYNFRVVISDGTDALASSSEMVTVGDGEVDAAPTFSSGLVVSRSFDTGVMGSDVGTFSASGTGVIMYELLGADAALFSVNTDGMVSFATDVAYTPTTRSTTDDNDYYFTVRAYNDSGADTFHDLQISITGSNHDPAFDGLTDVTVLGGNKKVAELKGTDSDGDKLTFSLGGTDADKFEIIDDVLRLKEGVDYIADGVNTYNLEVSVSDGMSSVTQNIVVEITENNVTGNSRPEFLPNTPSVLYTNEAIISRFGASDADGDVLVIALKDGGDSAHFDISSAGVLSFRATPDYENPLDADGDNVYELTITVSDGKSEIFHDITVHVTDKPEDSTQWMSNFDVEVGKRLVGSFPLEDSGSDSELVVDKQPPGLVSVIPVFSALGTKKLVVTFNEKINAQNVSYGQFRLETEDTPPNFDNTIGPVVVGGNMLELFLTDDFGGDTFRLIYTSGDSIQDTAGNPAGDFDAEGKVLSMPIITNTVWSDNGTETELDDDVVTFKFNGNIAWTDTLANVLAAGRITWTDTADPLMVANTVDQTNYSVSLQDDVIEIKFVGVELPVSDNIEFKFAEETLSLNIPGTGVGVGLSDELVASVDSKVPDQPTLDVVTDTLQYADLATDGYINIAEQGGSGFRLSGTSPDNTADLNVRIKGGAEIEDVIADTPSTWDYTVMDDTAFEGLMDGDVINVEVYLTDDADNQSSPSQVQMLTVDLMKPSLTAADARALEGSDQIFISIDDTLLMNDIDASAFVVTINGEIQTVDTVSANGSTLEIDLDDAVMFDDGDDVLITYNSSGIAAGSLVYDKAGNSLESFDRKVGSVTEVPLITAIMLEDVAGGLKRVVLTFNHNIEAYNDPLENSDIVIAGSSNFTGVPTIAGTNVEVTLTAEEVTRLEDLSSIELVLQADTLTIQGKTDANFTQSQLFDFKPPEGLTVDLQPNSDTGNSTVDNSTMTAAGLEFRIVPPPGEDVAEATVSIEDEEGNLLRTEMVTFSLVFTLDFTEPALTNTIGEVYRIFVSEATDSFGNTSTISQEVLEVHIDTHVAFVMTDAVDFGGGMMDGTQYVIPNDPDADDELTVKLRYEGERGNVGDLIFRYRYRVASDEPDWDSIAYSEVDQSATTFMSVHDTDNNEFYIEFNIRSETMFDNTYLDAGENETYFQFQIEDKAGNTTERTETVEIATDLDLSLSFSTGHMSDTGLSDADFNTRGIDDGINYFVKYHFASSATNTGGSTEINSVKVRAKKYDLTTGILESDYFYNKDVLADPDDSGDLFVNTSGERSVEINYMGTETYFHAQYDFGFTNALFGTTAESDRQVQTVVVDREAPELTEAIFVGNGDGDTFTVNNLYLFTSTDANDFILRRASAKDETGEYVDKTGTNDYLQLRNPVEARGYIQVENGGDTNALSPSSTNSGVAGGIFIGFQTGLVLRNGDTVTISITSPDYSSNNAFIGDNAGNGLRGTFEIVFDATRVVNPGASPLTATIASNRFASTDTRDNIVAVTQVESPSIDSDPGDISLSTVGTEPLGASDDGLW